MVAVIYVTVSDEKEGMKIGRIVVQERLAACANMIPMKSIYWWENKVQMEPEMILILKTDDSLVDDVAARVKELHSYDVPCILEIKIARCLNPDYEQWVKKETGQK